MCEERPMDENGTEELKPFPWRLVGPLLFSIFVILILVILYTGERMRCQNLRDEKAKVEKQLKEVHAKLEKANGETSKARDEAKGYYYLLKQMLEG